jgi:hypothetical protein
MNPVILIPIIGLGLYFFLNRKNNGGSNKPVNPEPAIPDSADIELVKQNIAKLYPTVSTDMFIKYSLDKGALYDSITELAKFLRNEQSDVQKLLKALRSLDQMGSNTGFFKSPVSGLLYEVYKKYYSITAPTAAATAIPKADAAKIQELLSKGVEHTFFYLYSENQSLAKEFYSTLTDTEIDAILDFIKTNTINNYLTRLPVYSSIFSKLYKFYGSKNQKDRFSWVPLSSPLYHIYVTHRIAYLIIKMYNVPEKEVGGVILNLLALYRKTKNISLTANAEVNKSINQSIGIEIMTGLEQDTPAILQLTQEAIKQTLGANSPSVSNYLPSVPSTTDILNKF